jgi:hypothetical protein
MLFGYLAPESQSGQVSAMDKKQMTQLVSGVGLLITLGLLGAPFRCAAQQGAATGEPLAVQTTTLPTAYLRRPYRAQLEGHGGISPLKWKVTGGALPPGLVLGEDGVLDGLPTASGLFPFSVTVTDSGKPAYQRSKDLVLQVVAPLLAEWSRYPKIMGSRVEGAIKVSNQTGQDFDLTVIILAVNENGRATAVGYQHFTLKGNTIGRQIPFGENLPRGTYEINVDVVAEVAATNTIFRARLITGEKLQVQQGP